MSLLEATSTKRFRSVVASLWGAKKDGFQRADCLQFSPGEVEGAIHSSADDTCLWRRVSKSVWA